MTSLIEFESFSDPCTADPVRCLLEDMIENPVSHSIKDGYAHFNMYIFHF